MLVSVVIPNHGRDISVLRRSIETSTYKDTEIIEIDLGKERSVQRNIGIDASKGEALLILDSDQSVSPYLIEECVKLIKKGYSCVYIPEVIIASSFFGKIRRFEREFYTSTAVDVPRFVKRTACPKFDEEQKGTEDSDWGNRIRGVRATSNNVLYHHDDISILTYFKKKNYYAKSLNKFRERNPDDKILNPLYRCIIVYTEKGKWRKILHHPILFFFVMLIVFIRGIIYIKNVYAKR